MLLISGANQKVQLITSAAADIELSRSVVDRDATGVLASAELALVANITTAATTDVVPVVGAAKERNVTGLVFRNAHASTSCDCTVRITDGTTTEDVYKVTLLAGESCGLDENGNWYHLDASGGPYPAVGAIASQAEMEAGTSVTVAVTPGRLKFHPGVNKFWGLFTIAGATTAGYNVDAPTDNGVGDITVNITTDFSSASWCASVTVEMTATTYAVANARTPHVRFGGQAAGTLRCDCIDGTATTQLVKDPTVWHIAGWGDQA